MAFPSFASTARTWPGFLLQKHTSATCRTAATSSPALLTMVAEYETSKGALKFASRQTSSQEGGEEADCGKES